MTKATRCGCVVFDVVACARIAKRADGVCPCPCHRESCPACGHPRYWHSEGMLCGCCAPDGRPCVVVPPSLGHTRTPTKFDVMFVGPKRGRR